ncbi:MAG: SusC/RagA family TonB-linked outer membrane protein [Sphingobacteriales bacterium 44-15]|nr:MAG: SusC/RagA family TonB-linked outer membrane protein [Sphingobacteriales bacterium 44-15]
MKQKKVKIVQLVFSLGKLLVAYLFFLLIFAATSAQGQIVVTGKIMNERGEPLSGATVKIKGVSTGTSTNEEGIFSVNVGNLNIILVVSMVGFQTKEISLEGKTSIGIVLERGNDALSEIVVVGYGTQQRRSEITTAVSKLDNKVLENIPYSNVAAALQGTLAGVRVQTNSGQPGAAPNIIVRGGTSINSPNSSPPIYIIDGVLRSNMNDISAHDIKSIQILKDAAATAIYGAQGSNGVVIVETKSGQSGKTQINYKFDMVRSEVTKTYDILAGKDEAYFARLGLLATSRINPAFLTQLDGSTYLGGAGNDLTNNTTNSLQYLTPENQHKLNEGWESIQDPVDPSRTLIFNSVDWQSLLFRKTLSQSHAISVSGGTQKARFYLGLGYMDSKGIAIQTDYKRFTMNLNGELNINEKIKLFSRVMYSNTQNTQVPTTDVFKSSLIAPSTNKLYFEDGTLSPGRNLSFTNPFYRMSVYNPKNLANDLTLIVGGQAEIVEGLTFSPLVSLQYRGGYSRNFLRSYLDGPTTFVTSRTASGSYSENFRPQVNAVLNYAKVFNEDHDFEIKAGLSYLWANNISLSATGQNAATDIIPTLNASATPTAVSGSETQHALVGYFSRATYNYKGKYLFGASLRYDGASNLGADNKWGLFPGVSAGWNIDREKFWGFLPTGLAKLKLRASYGVTGNISGLGLYQAQGEYNASSRYYGSSGIMISTLPNQNLKWEQSKTFDFGADLGLFNNRVNVIFDYYRRVTENLLTSLTLPPSTGFPSILTNYGTLENKGYEVELSARVLSPESPLQWNIALNAAKVNSKVLRLPENGIENNRVGGVYVFDPSAGNYAWLGGLQEGQRIGDLYAYQQISIYSTDAEAAKGPVDMLLPSASKIKYGGDVNWRDVDKNDTIDTRDRVYLGNIIPRVTGGFSSILSYKNLSFTARVDYTLGATVYNETAARLEGNFNGTNAISASMLRSWQKEGDVTDIPRYYWADQNAQWNVWNNRGNSRFYQSTDFLCLREVTLSYRLPQTLLKRAKISDITLNLTGSNLKYFTNYEGLSPEQTDSETAYPNPRSFIFGASITF